MGNFTEYLSKLREQLFKFWTSLNTWQKAGVAATILLIIGGIMTIVLNQEERQMSYLYENLEQDDVQAIAQELKNQQVQDYVIDDKGILVASDQVLPLRLKLAQEGLPAHGHIGWEKFDKQDFTKTEFEQNVNKLRAIQGELSRTIKSINGIIGARVHIVMPEKSLFKEDEKEPTAAVYVKTYRNTSLSERQIKGITHLVSRSVEGLRPEKVTIVNQDGKMLTKVEIDDPTTKLTNEMLAYRRTIEKELAAKVKALVGRIVGADRVEAKIDVEVDFTREEQTISDIDPDRVVVLSSNTTNQEMKGSGLNPTGIPGAKSNVPGEQEELAINSNSNQSTRNTERLNYEIAKQHRHRILPVGTIKRISAAVIVDGTQVYPADGTAPEFEARTPEEMKKIEDLVKSAIGFKQNRDEVTVHNVLFELAPMQVEALREKKKENRKYISTLVLSSVIALALVFFFAFIVRPYFRWLSYDPERKQKEAIVEEFKPDLEMGGMSNVQVKEDVPFEKLSPQEQILYLAKNEPARTTEAIRILLNPHQSNR
ncbi:flagellar basal-body MS-ring/collar protein FliF [Pseudobacteriovorax antillogorgiicola]|uniref:Flagellar M-ring protein n=1 Tax=Pseudobacteriovorax antillogorgiicola TaxID=1513793 RepID=A0A1Y6CKS7_9BACT|nr:flagellar basal-body MS-ring/collar protein FliF [Pseudobacteriovorax antillogorgiicola]TCS46115.1 flagellar M-ring protein FliF [Pseudobacteriovorax antillogorgiicola]SMF69484.1 flagellar M-ring protein FliF [Pseudobacteriovorax antillogorgiicola]